MIRLATLEYDTCVLYKAAYFTSNWNAVITIVQNSSAVNCTPVSYNKKTYRHLQTFWVAVKNNNKIKITIIQKMLTIAMLKIEWTKMFLLTNHSQTTTNDDWLNKSSRKRLCWVWSNKECSWMWHNQSKQKLFFYLIIVLSAIQLSPR